ncbi:MAG: hypothetical protein ABIS06_13160 [Vicinamibacterales bacterium]
MLEAVAAEGQKTRHHFDVVAEQMKSERNLAIDKSRATDERLTRHVDGMRRSTSASILG